MSGISRPRWATPDAEEGSGGGRCREVKKRMLVLLLRGKMSACFIIRPQNMQYTLGQKRVGDLAVK